MFERTKVVFYEEEESVKKLKEGRMKKVTKEELREILQDEAISNLLYLLFYAVGKEKLIDIILDLSPVGFDTCFAKLRMGPQSCREGEDMKLKLGNKK